MSELIRALEIMMALLEVGDAQNETVLLPALAATNPNQLSATELVALTAAHQKVRDSIKSLRDLRDEMANLLDDDDDDDD